MSHVKRYLDERKKNYAHDVARICAALDMNGWKLLAEAIRADFAEPTRGEELAWFMTADLDPSQQEVFEACDAMTETLSEDLQRDLAARLLCRVNGLNPDEKNATESRTESQAETLAAFAAARVDAGPETL